MVRKCTLILLAPLLVSLFLVGATYATEITDVTWDLDMHIIHIKLDSWPGVWDGWRMYVDGQEMPMEGDAGEPVVRPNAPLDQPPTGLIVGTLPWVTGLDNVDFPCCGTIQFYIPGEGLTNVYEFNLRDFGCATASTEECPSEWTVHEGDLVIEGTETRLIENTKFFQKGNIYVRDTATLIIRNSELMMARGDVPTVHVYIFVDPMATLIIDNSLVYPLPGGGADLVCVMNRGEVRMTDSPTQIHYFDMSAGAQFTMANSEMVYTIGGLLQVTGGSTTVTDSTLGALGLSVPAGAHLDVTGLQSGVYFDYWDVHDMIPDADYGLVLERTTILKDDFTGELEHGPYERGWIFFLDPDAHVRISDSELRKVFLDIRNETAAFQGLRVGVPASLTYRDIVLTNVIVKGQWPFTITDSDVTITNSNYLFLQPSGSSTVRLINSHMVEFIPRNFFGTMIFENGLWTEAGEIIGGVPYHSMANDFIIKGSLKMEGLRENLQWKNAQVTREFDVVVTDVHGDLDLVGGVVIKVGGQAYVTDDTGKTKFNMIFNETNYNQLTTMEVWQSGRLIVQQQIDFFTETPIRIEGLSASTAAVLRVTREGNVLADGPFYGAGFYSGSADIAEWVPVSEPVEPGDVLELDPISPDQYCKAIGPCSDLVVGVVSSNPGVILGAEPQTPDSGLPTPDRTLLALIGVVPVKVTNEGGPIQPGDLLTTSSTAGYAMRWDPDVGSPCNLVGKALGPLTEESGIILVLLTAH